MDWQPIETAPKDGTEILVVLDGRVWLCSYVREHTEESDDAFMPKGTVYGGGWYIGNDGFIPSGQEGMTHWMPLPEPPK